MKDDTTPATKADIQMLMDSIGKLYDANERWKDEVMSDVKRHFDVVVEQIRHDLKGANREAIEVHKDRTNDHETRIGRLEARAGI